MRLSPVFAATLVALASSSAAFADSTKACSDAFDQSQVKRDDGKLIDARALLRVCGAPACSRTQQKLCSQWLADVDARMPSFVLAAKDAAGADLTDVTVQMDGVQVATKLDGRAIDVDPGPHAFVFALADGTKAETKAVAEERGKGKVVSVVIGQAAVPAVVAAPVEPNPSGAAADPASSGGSNLRTAGFVTGGVGVAGLALGTIFGVLALSTKGSDCTNGLCQPGDSSKAYTQGDVSTVGFVAGGVLVAAGVTMVLIAPKKAKEAEAASVAVAPVVGGSVGGLQVVGRW